jgi:hypothetical protein
MADTEKAKASENDAALLAVEATEPVVLQEPDRVSDDAEQAAKEALRAPQPVVRRSGVLAYVVGAALLAGAGFGIAKYVFPDTGPADAIAALRTELDTQAAADAKLQSDLAKLAERPLPDATLADRIAALEAAVTAIPDATGLESRLATLEDRLTAIEAASASGEGAPAAALAAMSRELTSLKAALDAQKGAGSAVTADIEAASAAAQARLNAAEAAAQSAARQAALSHVRASFESGAPLGPALDGLKSLGAEIPETLAAAVDGLPSLLSLQEGFAEPARAALDASIRADMGEGWTNRLSAFLRSQSGARSLTPQEGTDPDAVLSRAEAALRDGQIKAALAELAGLPPAGAEAMAPWIADATRRLDAEQAITDLSAALNGQ